VIKRPKHIETVLLSYIFIALSVIASPQAWAQSDIISEAGAKSALEFGQLIKTEKLLTENVTSLDALDLDTLPPEDRLRHIRQHAHGTIALSNKLDRKAVLTRYKMAVEASGNDRDRAVFELHKSLLTQIDLSKKNTHSRLLLQKLEVAAEDKDWYVASNAWLLMGILNSFENNPNLALQQVQQAYKKIPNEISPYVTDARILTLEMTTYLNNLLLNPELAIENTAEFIKQKRAAGYPIDGSSLLNNLLYSLSMWREYEVSTQLAQVVLELEKEAGSNTPGLTESRVATLLIKQSRYEEALPHILRGLDVANIPAVTQNLEFLEVNALAGSDKVRAAEKRLKTLERTYSNKKDNKTYARLISAKLAIAIAKGDQEATYKLSNVLLDLNAQNLLRSYSTNTSKLVASLENTKERQAEREDALKREAEQQKRTNQLLWVLVIFLSIAAVLAVIFARYRNNISKELAIKTLEAEDADRMKSEFLGMVSHELRTPLNGIVGIADLLSMQAPTKDLRHKAGIILDSSNKLTHVIESIVDMSTIDGDKMELYPEPVNVHSIVTELDQQWRPVIEEKGVTFTSFVDSALSGDIILDKSRFRQCLDNLLSNAAKFTDSGRVHLHVTGKQIENTNETEITAIVADTGQGMNKAVQGKLFTPFLQADSTMTRKHGGSGLGLAITQSLAGMMGGGVTMMSTEGRGSEFTLTVRGERSDAAQLLDDVEELIENMQMAPLSVNTGGQAAPQRDDTITLDIPEYAPIQAITATATSVTEETPDNTGSITAPAPDIQASAALDTDDLRGLKVLIVEDIPANQDVIKLFLDPEGCESLCALNGVEALDILNTQAIDVILMDIRMPEMDGIDATRAIRESGREYKNTPIIALTADVSAETNAACMAAGTDIFLTKPVMARDLIEAIQFVLRFQDKSKNVSAA